MGLKANIPCPCSLRTPKPRQALHDVVLVVVGGGSGGDDTASDQAKATEFSLDRRLLESSSPFFRDRLCSDGIQEYAEDEDRCVARVELRSGAPFLVLHLPRECPDMFALFSYWLLRRPRRGFYHFVEDAIYRCRRRRQTRHSKSEAGQHGEMGGKGEGAGGQDRLDDQEEVASLHWDLVNLHLFAAEIGLPPLQDAAIDALQDLHLMGDWDVSAALVAFVYGACDAAAACRLRKWAVAMTAWSLSGSGLDMVLPSTTTGSQDGISSSERDVSDADSSNESLLRRLFASCAAFRADYAGHVHAMRGCRLQLCAKNPQLRLTTNHARSEDRHFGFRQCSFHTHRSTVGQGRCPNSTPDAPPPPHQGSERRSSYSVTRQQSQKKLVITS